MDDTVKVLYFTRVGRRIFLYVSCISPPPHMEFLHSWYYVWAAQWSLWQNLHSRNGTHSTCAGGSQGVSGTVSKMPGGLFKIEECISSDVRSHGPGGGHLYFWKWSQMSRAPRAPKALHSNRSQEASFFKFWNRRPARTYAWRNLRAMQHWSKVAFGAQRLFWTFSGGNPMTALSWCFWGCPDITLPVKIEARLSYNDSFHSPG